MIRKYRFNKLLFICMNYMLFILLTIITILLFHYLYANIYDSIKLYTTYEKNIKYNDVSLTKDVE